MTGDRPEPRRHAAARDRLRARAALVPRKRSPTRARCTRWCAGSASATATWRRASFRCDANVSVRRPGEPKLGTRSEIKNLNSFRFMRAGDRVRDRAPDRAARGRRRGRAGDAALRPGRATRPASMRSKEDAHDYRYFPDPDLLPLVIDAGAASRRCARRCRSCPQRSAQRFVEQLRRWPATTRGADCVARARRVLRRVSAALDAAAPSGATPGWPPTGSPVSSPRR